MSNNQVSLPSESEIAQIESYLTRYANYHQLIALSSLEKELAKLEELDLKAEKHEKQTEQQIFPLLQQIFPLFFRSSLLTPLLLIIIITFSLISFEYIIFFLLFLANQIVIQHIKLFIYSLPLGVIVLVFELGLLLFLGSKFFSFYKRKSRRLTEIESIHSRLEKVNIAKLRDRYQVLKNLINLWKKDMNPRQKLDLDLNLINLRGDGIAPNCYQQIPDPNPKHRNWKINLYQDNWLTLQGKFLDRTQFELKLIEFYQLKFGKNQNNKSRIRAKSKKFELTLTLKFDPDLIPALSRLASETEEAVNLPATASLKCIELRQNKLKMKVKLLSPQPRNTELFITNIGQQITIKKLLNKLDNFPYETSIMFFYLREPYRSSETIQARQELLTQTITLMFLSAYQILNLARTVSHQTSNE